MSEKRYSMSEAQYRRLLQETGLSEAQIGAKEEPLALPAGESVPEVDRAAFLLPSPPPPVAVNGVIVGYHVTVIFGNLHGGKVRHKQAGPTLSMDDWTQAEFLAVGQEAERQLQQYVEGLAQSLDGTPGV